MDVATVFLIFLGLAFLGAFGLFVYCLYQIARKNWGLRESLAFLIVSGLMSGALLVMFVRKLIAFLGRA